MFLVAMYFFNYPSICSSSHLFIVCLFQTSIGMLSNFNDIIHSNYNMVMLNRRTPSFLSLSRAPCRKSRETSSFSSSHWITKGSNHLHMNRSLDLNVTFMRSVCVCACMCEKITGTGVTHAGYSGTLLLKKGRSLQYSL